VRVASLSSFSALPKPQNLDKALIANLLANSLTGDTLNQADEEKAAAMLKKYPFIQKAIT